MESTLSIVWAEYKARVGDFLGWGRGADYGDTAWTSAQSFKMDGIVASALRRFYHQAKTQGMATAYDWSFLKPTATLIFASGASTIALPDDFGGFEDQITVNATSSTSMPWRIQWTNEGLIRERYSVNVSQTGPPMLAAQQPLKGTSPTQGQKFQLLIFPLADQEYTLQVPYYVNPDYLSTPFPYAYGGSQHSETILEGCLAVAEEREDDMPRGTGPHGIAYERCLECSIGIDRRNKPQRLGRNADRSDEEPYSRRDVHGWAPAATYNGAAFS